MRQMIFLCVFHNVDYLRLLDLCMESLLRYGNVCPATTDIVLYTSSSFRELVETQTTWYDRVIIVINDAKNTAAGACRARLDVFDLALTQDYDKILYLDVDVLILKDIGSVFDILERDVLYAVEEGYLHHDYWGGILFGDDIGHYPSDQKGFNAGVLLFRNSPAMRRLFEDVRMDIIQQQQCPHSVSLGVDAQSYFNYHAFRCGLYDNERLGAFVELHLTTPRRRFPSFTTTLIHFIDPHTHKEMAMRDSMAAVMTMKDNIRPPVVMDDQLPGRQ